MLNLISGVYLRSLLLTIHSEGERCTLLRICENLRQNLFEHGGQQ